MASIRKRAAGTKTWSPSPSPSPPLELSSADRLALLNSHAPFKPSSLPSRTKDGKKPTPLVVLSPEELEKLANEQEGEEEDEEDEEEEEEPLKLWEEVANAVLWTIPFGFLYTGMDFAVHAQFGTELPWRTEFGRLANALPPLFLLAFLSPRLPSRVVQPLLFVLCVLSGITLVHLTSRDSYLKVMRQAPGLGVLWVWSVVKMDLAWAVLGLLGVGGGVWWRDELKYVWGR